MHCSRCGTENSARVKFCAKCSFPSGASSPAERRQLTVLFCDIVGYSSLVEKSDPEPVREFLNSFYDICDEAIEQFDGHLAQYLGDGILAYFGYPAAHEDDAGRAVLCAFAILARAANLLVDGVRPSLRIGIHTGLVVVGEVGNPERREPLAQGGPPNIANRLQSEAAPDTILITESTRSLLGGQFTLEDLGPRALKGLSLPTQVYRVIGKSGAASRFHAMTSAHGLTPFVGRERELHQIRTAWAEAAEGRGRILILRGEAGMGKSRLLEAAGQIATGSPREVFDAQCSPYQMNNPLFPVVDMIERRLGIEAWMDAGQKLDLLEQFVAGRGVRIEEAMPLLRSLFADSGHDRYPAIDILPQKRLQLTILLIVDLLLHSAGELPVLLLIEDLHWADPSTIDLLGEIAVRLVNLPVLMMVTTRPITVEGITYSIDPKFKAAWTELPQCNEVPVAALNADDTRKLIARVAGPKLLPMTLIQEVASRTGGIPLFIEAVLRTVMSSDKLRELDDRYELAGALPSNLIPTTIQDSLMARIDGLGPDRSVAQAAAAIGREFSFELLREVLCKPADRLISALQHMVALELIAEEGTPPAATYAFRHALIQDAAYESLLLTERQKFHRKIAETLVCNVPDVAETKPELLARHHEGAGLVAEATAGWMKAGQQAKQRLALRECEAYLRKAISLLETLPEDAPGRLQSEMEAQLALGQALTETFGWASQEMKTAFIRARDLCQKRGNPIGLLQSLNALSGAHLLRGNLPEALETAKPVLAMAKELGEATLQICAGNLISFPAHYLGDFQGACRYAEEALALYTLERESTIMASYHLPCSFACAHIRALSLLAMGYVDQAEEQWRQGWTRLDEMNIAAATTFGFGYTIHGHFFRRDWSATAEMAEMGYQRAAEEGFMFWASHARVYRAWAQAMSGDPEQGITELQTALESYRLTGTRLDTTTFTLMMAEAQWRAERDNEALSTLQSGLHFVTESGERMQEAELYRLKGEIHAARGELAMCETSLRRAVETARAQHARLWELRAAVAFASILRDQGRTTELVDVLKPVEEWFTEGHDLPERINARAILESVGATDQPCVPETPPLSAGIKS